MKAYTTRNENSKYVRVKFGYRRSRDLTIAREYLVETFNKLEQANIITGDDNLEIWKGIIAHLKRYGTKYQIRKIECQLRAEK